MEKKLVSAFEQVTMPEACAARIEKSLKETRLPAARYEAEPMKESRFGWLAPVAAVLALVLILGAAGMGLPREEQLATAPPETEAPTLSATVPVSREEHFYFPDSGQEVIQGVNEKGEGYGSVQGPTGVYPSWLQDVDGRLYFVCNGESIDITDLISTEEPFTYAYTNPKGIRCHMAVGRVNDGPYTGMEDNVGWAVWYRNMNEAVEGERYTGWISGSSNGHWNNALDEEFGWHEKAQQEFDIPWS